MMYKHSKSQLKQKDKWSITLVKSTVMDTMENHPSPAPSGLVVEVQI